MIQFVNAKINIGLNIVGKRDDGYHLLETCFYPVGLYNGTPVNPEPFCDILELTEGMSEVEEGSCQKDSEITYFFSGNRIDCPPEKNLIIRAGNLFLHELTQQHHHNICCSPLTIHLYKMIPDGAGLGGGSADATFTLRLLNEKFGNPFSDKELEKLAVRLGADCPVFVRNKPVFAEGIGEIFSEVESEGIIQLSTLPYWIVIAKPDLQISTREAFAGLQPADKFIPLREAIKLPIDNWKNAVTNDFETSLFPLYPVLKDIKEFLYQKGADFASMTGSGAAIYGIFSKEASARVALRDIDTPYKTICRL